MFNESDLELLNSGIKAPVVSAKISHLGGKGNESIFIHLSLDPKESWANNIYHNSRFAIFSIFGNTLELNTRQYNLPKFRKTKVRDINDVISKINSYIAICKQSIAESKTMTESIYENLKLKNLIQESLEDESDNNLITENNMINETTILKNLIQETKKELVLEKLIKEAVISNENIPNVDQNGTSPISNENIPKKKFTNAQLNYKLEDEILPNGNLKLTLNEQGKEELQEILENHPDWDDYAVVHELMDGGMGGFWGNGWADVTDQDIIGLTSAFAVAKSPEYNDDGQIINAEGIWAYMDYQVKSMTEDLLENGYIILQSGK